MKITICENRTESEVEVIINCKQSDEHVLKLISCLRSCDNTIIGELSGQSFILSPQKVLYIESVDKKTFIYTDTDVYSSPLRLYALEDKLSSEGFFRASKSVIINLSNVRSLRPDFGGRLVLTMNNDERITASRQYSYAIKEQLGI